MDSLSSEYLFFVLGASLALNLYFAVRIVQVKNALTKRQPTRRAARRRQSSRRHQQPRANEARRFYAKK